MQSVSSFQLPQSDMASNRGSQRRLYESANGGSKRPVDYKSEMTLKRKRVQVEAEAGSNTSQRDDSDSNDEMEDDVGSVSEEQYRGMLGDHLKRYRSAQLREAMACRFRITSKKKSGDTSAASMNRKSQKLDDYQGASYVQHLDNGLPNQEKFGALNLLDIGDGFLFEIPPLYDQLAPTLGLPGLEALELEEHILNGQAKFDVIVSTVTSSRLAKLWRASEHTNNLRKSLSSKKFSLKVLEAVPVPGPKDFVSQPERQEVSGTWRQILSETGVAIQCEVEVINKGDGFELVKRKLPKKVVDPAVVLREDNDKIGKFWASIVRKDLPRHHRNFLAYYRKQSLDAKKFAECCQREVKYKGLRSLRVMKAAPMRIRRLSKDMVLYWKKVDKEQAELRKKEEKEAAEALKREEELREARRQQQRLNFLLTQTELYSHFMQNKTAAQPTAGSEIASDGIAPDAALNLAEDAAEEAALKEAAIRAAQDAASQQKEKTDAFDNECSKLRDDIEPTGLTDTAPDIDLLHPSTMPAASTVLQPTLFEGILKEYQLKGLQWLVNCYEQGLNGILADEMGLGKTIQAMAFLAHLAEEKNIWGPFLVVAPASVLNNWADEANRFCPEFRILPYWGGLQERTVLRKNINPKRLYRKDAVFHMLITSYQLLVTDEKYLRRVKWQYMVLDEAQAIKSSTSIRWKTLLSFNCRNRLLLTGTPIQNNMAELWALLHFIMPTLFDSHEQFNEWFSKGIESHAEHGGTLNEHQLNRLHSILKPFMLRRVKKDVITEMTNKKEVVLPCTLSSRQQAFYQAIKNKISVADLFDNSGGHLNEKKVLNLMNIVIQLRKVCNHPDLFERNEGHSFVQFSVMQSPLLPAPFGELENVHYSGGHNPITYKVPKLLYRDGMCCLPSVSSGSTQGFEEKWLSNHFNIFSAVNVFLSINPEGESCTQGRMVKSDSLGFTRLLDLSPGEVNFLSRSTVLERLLFNYWQEDDWESFIEDQVCDFDDARLRAVSKLLFCPIRSKLAVLKKKLATGLPNSPFEALVASFEDRLSDNTALLRSANTFIPAVRAPQIEILCSDRGFTCQREEEMQNPWIKRLLVGFARTSDRNGPAVPPSPHHLIEEQDLQVHSQQPLLGLPYEIFGSSPPLQSFDFAKMLIDSGKLQTLDILLKRLRANNHRVLLFAQMTKMLNILEDYMIYRKYKYLRLDGSSSIMDRRDMVKDFQHRGDIFVFLLSTRAGGLGINLTAADTVIFYESDWNPTMDLQAMDRAHRLGQTKEVTVYRLICKGTVEEKIVKRASQKNTVQQLVMTGGHSQGDIFEAEEVVSLLLDDAELEQKMKDQLLRHKMQDKPEARKKGWGVVTAGTKHVRLDAEGGASLEEESAEGEGNAEKTAENTAPPAKSRQRKRKSDVEGKPPRPPKAPKTNRDHRDGKEGRNVSELPTKVRGRTKKSASITAIASGNQENHQISTNGESFSESSAHLFNMENEEGSPEDGFADGSSFSLHNDNYYDEASFL
ncbi:hypothetical protein GOP47_0010557 [Adiantum capillus-veneris]|uniref:Chromatin-remodeling ATPase INO80 n=1 Tax=Adiantum capillus-veneris TaxID=13818 RepID=A0A9D4UVC1_ADICA|nr:hypothetical protein GOP47_0010557 [Adiantum capillus-veneris]